MGEAKQRRDQQHTLFHDAPNVKPIETLYALLSIDGAGNEGVIVAPMGGFNGPLICSDKRLLPALEHIAQAALELTGSTKGYTVATFQRVRTKQ